MADGIIDFEKAKSPHVFRRKENKLKAVKQALKEARRDESPKPGKGPGRGKKKRKK